MNMYNYHNLNSESQIEIRNLINKMTEVIELMMGIFFRPRPVVPNNMNGLQFDIEEGHGEFHAYALSD